MKIAEHRQKGNEKTNVFNLFIYWICVHLYVTFWVSVNCFTHLNQLTQSRIFTEVGDTSWLYRLGIILTRHPDQLSLAIPLWVGTISTSGGNAHH